MNFKQLGKAVEVAKQASPAGSEWFGMPGEPGAAEVCQGSGFKKECGPGTPPPSSHLCIPFLHLPFFFCVFCI